MLTKLIIENFKLFERAEIPLGNGFVFIGPNNRGKTTALQALALWHFGLRGFLLADRTDKSLQTTGNLREYQWKKREIENYLCNKQAISDIPSSRSLQKKDFYKLIAHIPEKDIDPEVSDVLDMVQQVAEAGATVTA